MKSKRPKFKQYAGSQLDVSRRAGQTAWRAREDARRLALPAWPNLHQGRLIMTWPIVGVGWAAVVRLYSPPDSTKRRPRSDQYLCTVDDVLVGERMGLGAVMQHLKDNVIPRQPTQIQARQILGILGEGVADLAGVM